FLIRRPGHAWYFIFDRAVKTFQAVAFNEGDHIVFQIVEVLFHRFAEYIIARSRQARAFLVAAGQLDKLTHCQYQRPAIRLRMTHFDQIDLLPSLVTRSAYGRHTAEVHHQWQGQRSFSARTIFAICELESSTVSFSNLPAENQTNAAAAVLGGKKRDKEVVTVEKARAFVEHGNFERVGPQSPANCDCTWMFRRKIQRGI